MGKRGEKSAFYQYSIDLFSAMQQTGNIALVLARNRNTATPNIGFMIHIKRKTWDGCLILGLSSAVV